MKDYKKIILGLVGGVVFALTFFSVTILMDKNAEPVEELGVARFTSQAEEDQKQSWDFIGTSSSSLATLTSAYSGASSTYPTNLRENMHLEAMFTAATVGQYLQLRVETSNDNCQTFYPLSVKNITTSTVDIYTQSATDGIPLNFFQGITTATGTTYYLADDYNVVGECVRISARCNTGSSCTAYVRGTFTTN